jgi:hypothetical protein
MKEALLVDVVERLAELQGNRADLVFFQLLAGLLPPADEPEEVLLDILEHKVCLIDHPDDLLELDDIGMVHFS